MKSILINQFNDFTFAIYYPFSLCREEDEELDFVIESFEKEHTCTSYWLMPYDDCDIVIREECRFVIR